MKTPFNEAIKEIYRWFVSYFYAGLISLLVSALPFFPVDIFPEKLMIAGLSIPFRIYISTFILPALIRALDKYKYLKSKEGYGSRESKGLIGFNLLNDLM